MYTDTVSPHSEGMKFAIDYYGVDHVMYGSDYPCWSPAAALGYFDAIEGLSAEDRQKILHDNAVRSGCTISIAGSLASRPIAR